MTVARNASTPEIVNGLNLDDLNGLIQRVVDDPATGLTTWQVNSQWQGRTHTRADVESFTIGGERSGRKFSIDIDEPAELGGGNMFANPQEYLFAALNACMMVGYVAQCALRRIKLTSLAIETRGDIDLRGFLGIDPAVCSGYDNIEYTVRIAGDGTPEQFADVHKAVMATSPNFHNISMPVTLRPHLIVE
jgi:uncharacterized OsmC-like protein